MKIAEFRDLIERIGDDRIRLARLKPGTLESKAMAKGLESLVRLLNDTRWPQGASDRDKVKAETAIREAERYLTWLVDQQGDGKPKPRNRSKAS